MLLAIDAGNTNIVFAVFDGDTLKGKWRLSADRRRTADEYAVSLAKLMELGDMEFKAVKDVIISTVVPQNLFALKTLGRNYFHCEPMIIGENIKVPVKVELDRPSEVGADRLVNAVAAYTLYKQSAIIIDFGTATTFDVINDRGDYLGGVIAPGINLSMDALHMTAAKLPEIAIKKPGRVIGKNTVEAIQSGVYFGYLGLIEGIIDRIREEHGENMVTVATGGLASLFSKGTQLIENLEEDLTIEGLNQIYKVNKA